MAGLMTKKKSVIDRKSKTSSNEYNSNGGRKVFSNNFFEKIKPIVRSLKNITKNKKETKDRATTMD